MKNFTSTERLLFKAYAGIQENLVKNVSQQFIKYIVSGKLVPGYIFPSIARLHLAMGISKLKLTKIMKILDSRGFITYRNGRPGKVNPGPFVSDGTFYDYNVVNAKGLLNTERGHVYHKNKLVTANLLSFTKDYPLPNSDAADPLLLEDSCRMLNKARGTDFKTSEVHCFRNLQYLFMTFCTKWNDKKAVFLVPENYLLVISVLKLLRLKMVLLEVDDHGICTDQIEKHCASGNVRAVIFQSAYGHPFSVDTTRDRIHALYQLQLKYKFKVIENGRYLPRESTPKNYLLELFKDSPDDLIYIWQLTMMEREARYLSFVRSSAATNLQIQKSSEIFGATIEMPIAYAVREMLLDKSYPEHVAGNTKAMNLLLKNIRDIFLYDDFWDESGIKFENDTAFFLKPKPGYFAPNVFKKLQHAKVNFIDPASYVIEKKPLTGIWLDFSFYLDHKHFKTELIALEKILRTTVKESKAPVLAVLYP